MSKDEIELSGEYHGDINTLMDIIDQQAQRIAEMGAIIDDLGVKLLEARTDALNETLRADHLQFALDAEQKLTEQQAQEQAELKAYVDKNINNMPEGCTATDAEKLRDYNFQLAQRIAELEALLKAVRDDLRMRSDDGVVNISSGIWVELCDSVPEGE